MASSFGAAFDSSRRGPYRSLGFGGGIGMRRVLSVRAAPWCAVACTRLRNAYVRAGVRSL